MIFQDIYYIRFLESFSSFSNTVKVEQKQHKVTGGFLAGRL